MSEFEEREAATFAHCSWFDWLQLSTLDKVITVAQYRMHYLIDAHVNDSATKQSQTRKSGRASNNATSRR